MKQHDTKNIKNYFSIIPNSLFTCHDYPCFPCPKRLYDKWHLVYSLFCKPEIGVVIAIYGDGEMKTDMFGNSYSEVKPATFAQIAKWRPDLILKISTGCSVSINGRKYAFNDSMERNGKITFLARDSKKQLVPFFIENGIITEIS